MSKYKFIEEKVDTMSSKELRIFLNILKKRALALLSTLELSEDMNDLDELFQSVKKLNNRVSEFDGGAFLILVVGPVKSGKSTLVNLIAHAHVSPTHFLECTVRPSIISKGSKECITRIFSKADSDKKVEQFDAVIDSLRGFEKLEEISMVNSEEYELNDENLDKYVTQVLEEDVINNDDTLMTSITTSGGELLRENVFLIDMPGLDGGYANFDNPIYKTISQRADFVIFVQSSNSAISKVSNRFLQLLQENNPKVPVCLIHNVFEAAYWHSEEDKQAVIEDQMEFARNEITRRNFLLNDWSYSINLGKVADADNYTEVKSLQEEVKRFRDLEKDMYGKVISNNTDIRLRSSIGRALNQLEKLDILVDKLIHLQENKKNEYVTAAASFDKYIQEAIGLNYDGAGFRKTIETYIDDDLTEFVEIVKEHYDSSCNSAFAGGARNRDATRAIVAKFLTDSSTAIKEKFYDFHEHSLVKKYLRKLSNLGDDETFIEEVNSFLREKGCSLLDLVPRAEVAPVVDFTLCGAYEVKNIHYPFLRNIIPNPFGSYSIAEIRSFLEKAMDCIIGIEHRHTGRTIKGYLQLNIRMGIYKAVNELYEQYVPVSKQGIVDFLKGQREQYLNTLIPNIYEFEKKENLLQSINKQIQDFKNLIKL